MLSRMAQKLLEALSSVEGWWLVVLAFCWNYFAGSEAAILITLLAVVLDAVWGIGAAVKQGKFALSELARDTVMKMAVYGSAMICFIGVDKLLHFQSGLTLAVVCAVIVLVELWSMCASALICFPEMPFLRILRRALIGEIARKLGVRADEVKKVLEGVGEKGKEAKSREK